MFFYSLFDFATNKSKIYFIFHNDYLLKYYVMYMINIRQGHKDLGTSANHKGLNLRFIPNSYDGFLVL